MALKFHAAISPRRAMLDHQQDLVDIGRVVAKRFEPADEQLAIEIAGLAYPGAEQELAALVDDLRRPTRQDLTSPGPPARWTTRASGSAPASR